MGKVLCGASECKLSHSRDSDLEVASSHVLRCRTAARGGSRVPTSFPLASRFTLDAVFTGDYESGLRYGCSQSLYSRNCYIPHFDSYVGSVAVMHALTCALMTSKATKKEGGRISKIRPRHGTRTGETHTAATRHLRGVRTRGQQVFLKKGGHSTRPGPVRRKGSVFFERTPFCAAASHEPLGLSYTLKLRE